MELQALDITFPSVPMFSKMTLSFFLKERFIILLLNALDPPIHPCYSTRINQLFSEHWPLLLKNGIIKPRKWTLE